MALTDKEEAPQELALPGTWPTSTWRSLWTASSLAHPAHPSTEERPCACYDGLVFIGHLVEEDGEEVERVVRAGARAGAFILDAESHDEANQILQSLPAWGIVKMQLTPLQSFETRREQDQQVLERLEATLQQ